MCECVYFYNITQCVKTERKCWNGNEVTFGTFSTYFNFYSLIFFVKN